MSSEVANSVGKHFKFAIRLYAIEKIDTVAMTFDVDMRFFLSFKAPEGWEPELGVHFLFSNSVGDVTVVDTAPPNSNKGGAGYKRKNWRLRGTFSGNFSLFDFPLDIQQLPILVRIPRVVENGVQYVYSAKEECELQSLGAIRDSWNCLKMEACIFVDNKGRKEIVNGRELDLFKSPSKSEFVLVTTVQRKSTYYVANIAIPNSFLVALTFSVYCIDTWDISDRMSIILTILLTATAFKFSVATLLPVLSYQTCLDKYILGQMMLVFLIALESIIVCKMPTRAANVIDWITVTVLMCSFFLYHVYWAWWLQSTKVKSVVIKAAEENNWMALLSQQDTTVLMEDAYKK